MTTRDRIATLLLDARFRAEGERDDLRVALGILAGEYVSEQHQTPRESLDYLRRCVAKYETTRPNMARCYRLAYERLADEMGVGADTERNAAA